MQEDQFAPNPPSRWDPTPVAIGVSCNLQPLTGTVQATPAGQEVRASWRNFLPAGTNIQPGDGLVRKAGVGPDFFLVQFVGPQGAPWDTEVLLDAAEEAIPGAPV